MGCRSVQRYLCSGQGGLSASVLPEDKQAGSAKEHTLCSRYSRNRIEPLVRGYAFGAEFLPDFVTVDGYSLSHHVHADVLRSHCLALQDEEAEPPVPHRQRRQRPDVVHRWFGILWFIACICAELHPSKPDFHR